jgi:hypothetical protein
MPTFFKAIDKQRDDITPRPHPLFDFDESDNLEWSNSPVELENPNSLFSSDESYDSSSASGTSKSVEFFDGLDSPNSPFTFNESAEPSPSGFFGSLRHRFNSLFNSSTSKRGRPIELKNPYALFYSDKSSKSDKETFFSIDYDSTEETENLSNSLTP